MEYHGKFELIRTRLNLLEQYLVSAYLAGLRNDTQMHICMFQPQSVRKCLMLGRLYELAHPRKPSANTWQQTKQTTQNKANTIVQKED